jgi:isopentenyl diphosphate isomerase/L-lactate dehydrogenase-like FMN-dependent dehydrogenase
MLRKDHPQHNHLRGKPTSKVLPMNMGTMLAKCEIRDHHKFIRLRILSIIHFNYSEKVIVKKDGHWLEKGWTYPVEVKVGVFNTKRVRQQS